MWKSKPTNCKGCPLADVGLSYAPARGHPSAPYVIIGQGPGETEAHFGTPFHPRAPAGARLADWLASAGISQRDCFVDNSVRCWVVQRNKHGKPIMQRNGRMKSRNPTLEESKECLRRHKEVWEEVLAAGADKPRRVLLAVGVPAAAALVKESAGLRDTGSLVPWRPESLP